MAAVGLAAAAAVALGAPCIAAAEELALLSMDSAASFNTNEKMVRHAAATVQPVFAADAVGTEVQCLVGCS